MLKNNIQIITAAAALLLCIIAHNVSASCVILAVCVVLILIENYLSRLHFRRSVTRLTDYITSVQDDLSLAELNDIDEGELGILQSEIYKVVALLREKYSAENKRNTYMSDLLSDISHQVKTPLTAIQLMTELLEQSELDDDRRIEYAGKIDGQVTRITWLIRNLLTLSQIEAGVLKMKHESITVSELTEQVCSNLDVIAELKGVAVIKKISGDIEIKGDKHWLSEALMNIVKNCIEHTDEGGYVEISAEKNSLFTSITITDNGSGIAAKDIPHIFERFYKAENSSSQSVGIGLALAKQIITHHNGTVDVSSEQGKGSAFTVKLYISL